MTTDFTWSYRCSTHQGIQQTEVRVPILYQTVTEAGRGILTPSAAEAGGSACRLIQRNLECGFVWIVSCCDLQAAIFWQAVNRHDFAEFSNRRPTGRTKDWCCLPVHTESSRHTSHTNIEQCRYQVEVKIVTLYERAPQVSPQLF